jgi:hypothetical protein
MRRNLPAEVGDPKPPTHLRIAPCGTGGKRAGTGEGDRVATKGEFRSMARTKARRLVEVCRSFSYKLNLENHGGPRYENADFFASRKEECPADKAAEVSQRLFEECMAEVRASVARFIGTMQQRKRPTGHGNAREFEQWKERQG